MTPLRGVPKPGVMGCIIDIRVNERDWQRAFTAGNASWDRNISI